MLSGQLASLCIVQALWWFVSGDSTCARCDRGLLRCRKISGIYTVRYLSQGYHPVVDVPAGACNVNVTELKNSRNYIALKASTGHWIVNGEWVKDKPGDYHGAGTQFRYDRDNIRCPSECIWGRGPLTHKVTVQLLYAWTNEGIVYEFTLPPDVEYTSPTNLVHSGRTVHRRRHHHQPHHVTRHTENQSVIQDTYPVPTTDTDIPLHTGSNQVRPPGNIWYQPRPEYVSSQETGTNYQALRSGTRGVRYVAPPQYTEQTGEATLQIPDGPDNNLVLQGVYAWRIAGFTTCTHTCGTGSQETKIVCVLKVTQVQVTDNNCDVSLRPPKQKVSCNTSPCPPQWEIHAWTACSVTCGRGTQARRVECKRRISGEKQLSVSASLCNPGDKPATTQQCGGDSCTRWETGDWGQCSVDCGVGERRRTLQCVDSRGRPVRAGLCDSPTPRDKTPCNIGACDHHWFVSPWSRECSSACGVGVRTRSVHCAAISGHTSVDTNCAADGRPSDQQSCQNKATGRCGNDWFTGPWGECSASCGEGVRLRPVLCIEDGGVVSADLCYNGTRPALQEPCHQAPCGAQWHMSQWTQCPVTCGEGHVTRVVMCLDQDQQPVSGCDQSDRPVNRKSCNERACIDSRSDADPSCKDRYGNCQLVVQARLCRYDYYTQICCASCRREYKLN